MENSLGKSYKLWWPKCCKVSYKIIARSDKMKLSVLSCLVLLGVLSSGQACGNANFEFGGFQNVFIYNSMCSNARSSAMMAYCGQRGPAVEAPAPKPRRKPAGPPAEPADGKFVI
jgi:hypothetical protein